MKILLVDDEPLVLSGIARMLRAEACVSEVRTADDGFAAVACLDAFAPDLLITDIRMPEMDGLELIERVRRAKKCHHFIVISSYADFQYAQRAITLGVENYLLNPVDREELHLAIVEMARRIFVEADEGLKYGVTEEALFRRAESFDEEKLRRFVGDLIQTYRDADGPTARCVVYLTALVAQHPRFAAILSGRLQEADFAPGRDALYDSVLHVLKKVCAGKGLSQNAQNILAYLLATYPDSSLSLKTLSKAMEIHPNYASGIISKELGAQFVKYVSALRVIRAQEILLSEEGIGAQALAERTGFDNANHFFRVFKAYAGMTPGEYKSTRGIQK